MVHGIDLSEAMIAVLRNKIDQAGHRNITPHCGDVQNLPYADTTFDAALSLQMMTMGLGEEMWREKEKLALAWLEETQPTLKGPLTSDAWLGVGVK